MSRQSKDYYPPFPCLGNKVPRDFQTCPQALQLINSSSKPRILDGLVPFLVDHIPLLLHYAGILSPEERLLQLSAYLPFTTHIILGLQGKKNSKYENCCIHNSNWFLVEFQKVSVITDTLNIHIEKLKTINNSLTFMLAVKCQPCQLLLFHSKWA